jgi:serine/threonine-protein kinase
VVLKLLCRKDYGSWFLRIARATASLEHPGIVPCYEVGMVSEQPFLTLALVGGSNLSRRIAQVGPRSIEETIRIVRDVAAALEYAHGRGLIHGHLHPKHILINENGYPKLIGFGEYPLPEDAVFGNPLHLAPEQLQAAGSLTPRTDVYALAETAFWLLAGRHPFHESNVHSMLAIKTSGSAPCVRKNVTVRS